MTPAFSKKTHVHNGFVYHELKFGFGENRVATRYVSDDEWKARFSDARSVWVIWHALKKDSAKNPPKQIPLL